MHSRYLWAFFALIPFVSISVVSCGGDEDVASELRQAEGGRNYGGIYRWNETDGIKTLDPVTLSDAPSHHVVHQIGEQLVDFNDDLELEPELAHSWDISEDGLTYTYHIRPGVRFHDSEVFSDGKGRIVTAEDVKYSFDRILDSRAKSKGADYFVGKVVGAEEYYRSTQEGSPLEGGVSGFRVLDDSTFQVQLIEPFSAFKFYPALGFTYIYPREAVEHYGADFFRNLVGTGPFQLRYWRQDQELMLDRNPNYWRKDEFGNQLPYLDGLQVKFLPDNTQQLNEFLAGGLEESYRIPSEFISSVFEGGLAPGTDENPDLTSNYEQYELHIVPALSTQFYGMLTTADVFDDPRIRQAFNLAVDREKIVRFVLKGQAAGPAIHGLVPPSMPGYPVESINGYTFDPTRAQQLLAEAGYPDGRGFPPVTLQLNSGGGRNEEVAEAVQEMLNKNLKIDVGLKTVSWPQHTDLIDRGEAPFYRLGWIADYPDPENFLNLLYGENAAPAGEISPLNSTRYDNPEFDRMFEQALRTQDDAERMRLYAEAEQIAVNDAPMLWIFHDVDYRLVQPYVQGYRSNPMDRRDLTRVWFDFGGKK